MNFVSLEGGSCPASTEVERKYMATNVSTISKTATGCESNRQLQL